jgi:hypothetical protein
MKPHLAFLLLAGCGVFGGGGDDDHPMIDAGPSGLTLEWSSRPENIPDEPGRSPRVMSAAFQTSNMRVVGDAGPVAVGATVLEWAMGEEPDEQHIRDAPSGLYSKCLFDLVAPNGGYAYEITGTVTQNTTTTPFVIRDRGTRAVSISFEKMLMPGGQAEIEIRVRIDQIVGAVDFASVTPQGGMLVVDDSSPQIAAVRDALDDAFDHDD